MNICALSTAPGGAIAVVRVSGPDAIIIVNKMFLPVKKDSSILQAKGQTLHYGKIIRKGGAEDVVDDVMVSVFRAPHSYTGEDSVEISCHGSQYIINVILQLLIENGCRQAMPGEYTQRAFLNGKMDLSQAEAVADLIASTNAATHKMAMSQLRGNFSSELSALRDRLLHLTSLMELELDFSDHEDLEFADREELFSLACKISDRILSLKDSFCTGKALKEGVSVAIVGKTNVGKSTLLNLLLNDEKAIVSEIHGTTRDIIEDTTVIQGITFRFIDTAGLRETEDAIEQIGIERTLKKLSEALIVMWVTDCKPTSEEFARIQQKCGGKKLIVVRNKIDIADNMNAENTSDYADVCISAKEKQNIEELEKALVQAADIPAIKENDVIVTSARHYEALSAAYTYINNVIDGMKDGIPSDLLSEDLRACLSSLAEIVGGEITTDEVLGNIFSHFCVGK